jgi:hypothetical protein
MRVERGFSIAQAGRSLPGAGSQPASPSRVTIDPSASPRLSGVHLRLVAGGAGRVLGGEPAEVDARRLGQPGPQRDPARPAGVAQRFGHDEGQSGIRGQYGLHATEGVDEAQPRKPHVAASNGVEVVVAKRRGRVVPLGHPANGVGQRAQVGESDRIVDRQLQHLVALQQRLVEAVQGLGEHVGRVPKDLPGRLDRLGGRVPRLLDIGIELVEEQAVRMVGEQAPTAEDP